MGRHDDNDLEKPRRSIGRLIFLWLMIGLATVVMIMVAGNMIGSVQEVGQTGANDQQTSAPPLEPDSEVVTEVVEVPGPAVTKTVQVPVPGARVTVTQTRPTPSPVPGPVVTKTVTRQTPGPTVTKTVQVPGPTVTKTVTQKVPGPAVTVTKTITICYSSRWLEIVCP